MSISNADVMRIRRKARRREQRGLIGLAILVITVLFAAAYVGHEAIVEREALIDSVTTPETQ